MICIPWLIASYVAYPHLLILPLATLRTNLFGQQTAITSAPNSLILVDSQTGPLIASLGLARLTLKILLLKRMGLFSICESIQPYYCDLIS